MTPEFWKDKKVFLTGHTGFKGAWLCIWLRQLGAKIVGYSIAPPTKPSLFELTNANENMPSVLGDVRDLEHLRKVMLESEPEIVIHMAAQSLVVYSHSNPIDTYTTNVMGTVNTLEAIRNCKTVKAAIIVTSDKCYQNKEWYWGYRENDNLGGHDPYSNSKVCAEIITDAYRKSYFSNVSKHSIALSTVRAGNVIAGGDWAMNRLVPDVMTGLMGQKPIHIRNPNSIRPWQHVLEPLDGYLTLLERLYNEGLEYAEAWNFGPKEEFRKSVSWIVSQLCKLWGEGGHWEETPSLEPRETSILKLDCSKSEHRLGWKAKLDMMTTLKWINEWYKCYQSKGNILQITQDQVARYQSINY